jgi:hypothetical protein
MYKRQQSVHEKVDQQMDVWKCILSLIILNLMRDDFVSAEKIFSEEAGYFFKMTLLLFIVLFLLDFIFIFFCFFFF